MKRRSIRSAAQLHSTFGLRLVTTFGRVGAAKSQPCGPDLWTCECCQLNVFAEVVMEPSLWQHQTTDPIAVSVGPDPTVQAFASGLLAGAVIVATILLWHRTRAKPRAIGGRTLAVSGWGDLFRLVGGILRGVLRLIAGLLLLARVVLWPAGRRW